MSDIVKFNIGGQRHDVSRSLLEMHPESMLAKTTSTQWQKDPEAEVFIEGDGSRFRYVLDYLRHSKVTLPITESKEALLTDLGFYGIHVNEKDIDVTAMKKLETFPALNKTIVALTEFVDQTQIHYHSAQLALASIRAYLQVLAKSGVRTSSYEINVDVVGREAQDSHSDFSAFGGRGHSFGVPTVPVETDQDIQARNGANVHLNVVGLHLSAYSGSKKRAKLEVLGAAAANHPTKK